MTVDQENVLVTDEGPTEGPDYAPPEPQRGFVAEWAVTIILLLFGTTNLVQAFVIPTGSMEDTLLIGDHLLVDKLAYAPSGPVSKYILPYTDVKRGDIIVFRYPVEIQQTFVKRCIGVPGDRIKLVDKQLIPQRPRCQRTVRVSQDGIHRFVSRQFSRASPTCTWSIRRAICSITTW